MCSWPREYAPVELVCPFGCTDDRGNAQALQRELVENNASLFSGNGTVSGCAVYYSRCPLCRDMIPPFPLSSGVYFHNQKRLYCITSLWKMKRMALKGLAPTTSASILFSGATDAGLHRQAFYGLQLMTDKSYRSLLQDIAGVPLEVLESQFPAFCLKHGFYPTEGFIFYSTSTNRRGLPPLSV